MLYLYLKALHIVFITTWFAGMFYIVRLFIYNAEAEDRPAGEREVLRTQYSIMMHRLWFGITWPSALITLILGPWVWWMMGAFPRWLEIKLLFVLGLYAYHWSLHRLYVQQRKGIFRYSSQQLRLWNEVATLFLFAIVFLAVLKDSISWLKALIALLALAALLMVAIRVYKQIRQGKRKKSA